MGWHCRAAAGHKERSCWFGLIKRTLHFLKTRDHDTDPPMMDHPGWQDLWPLLSQTSQPSALGRSGCDGSSAPSAKPMSWESRACFLGSGLIPAKGMPRPPRYLQAGLSSGPWGRAHPVSQPVLKTHRCLILLVPAPRRGTAELHRALPWFLNTFRMFPP